MLIEVSLKGSMWLIFGWQSWRMEYQVQHILTMMHFAENGSRCLTRRQNFGGLVFLGFFFF